MTPNPINQAIRTMAQSPNGGYAASAAMLGMTTAALTWPPPWLPKAAGCLYRCRKWMLPPCSAKTSATTCTAQLKNSASCSCNGANPPPTVF